MPAIKAPATVLVTAASLRYSGTVRSTSKGEYLVKQLKSDSFSYVIVEDIAKDGAFDEAVKGVDVVAHTASPFHFQADDPQTLIEPAVKDTVGVLKSIEKNAPSVQRVVITPSAAAIVDTSKPTETIFTEAINCDDWNTFSTKEVEKKGKDAAGGDKYRASKTLAEQAAWAEAEAKKPNWDLATINPLMVLGPILQQIDNPANLNTSVAMLYKITHAKEGETPREVLLQPNMSFVDVRGGQRFINFKGLKETVKDTELGLSERGWGIA
ncbi:methylglyoxal reductase (NADPH-dependent) gre2 [Ceratobasidium sp. 395]|nr:methylglyoxal reductase (NADPH-dependent) gre2 [Ceratobasidium sp. 395]